ncbi:MAG: restriction endonuclease subunit S [Methanococcoides sp.]|nr:restriction endonuclease subunit S [Methanococcoides sp.]
MKGQNSLWTKVLIKDACESIIDCVNKTAPAIEKPTQYKMIRTTNVKAGWVNLSAVKFVNEDVYKKWTRRGKPRKGDVILTREAPLGEVGMLRSNDTVFLGQRLVQYRADPEKLDNRFLLYSFQGDFLQGQIKSLGSGATVEHMRVPDAEKLILLLPPLLTQHKIGAILSAYDDLIENNSRRIKILEEMAQALYREWFVKFRYPGHGKVKMVESELGMVPEGWGVKKLSTLVDTQYGYTESASEDEIGPKYVRGMDINKTSYIQWDTVPFCPINDINHTKYKLKIGDLIVIRMADPGKVGIIEKDIDAVFASYLIRLNIKSTRISPYFLFYFLLSDQYQSYVTGASTGTTRKSASAGVITDIYMIVPTDNILIQFEKQISTIRHLLNNLLENNSNLCRTRNLLVPKLISGKIDVSNIEIEMGEKYT